MLSRVLSRRLRTLPAQLAHNARSSASVDAGGEQDGALRVSAGERKQLVDLAARIETVSAQRDFDVASRPVVSACALQNGKSTR
jgi:hypothetical protein